MKIIDYNKEYTNENLKIKVGGNRIISTNSPVRLRIFSFIDEKGKVAYDELVKFIEQLQADGFKTNKSWISNNKEFLNFSKKDSLISLSKTGKGILKALLKYNIAQNQLKMDIEGVIKDDVLNSTEIDNFGNNKEEVANVVAESIALRILADLDPDTPNTSNTLSDSIFTSNTIKGEIHGFKFSDLVKIGGQLGFHDKNLTPRGIIPQ